MKGVDDFVRQGYREKISFKELWEGLHDVRRRLFIVSDDNHCRFSAWTYAKRRYIELADTYD